MSNSIIPGEGGTEKNRTCDAGVSQAPQMNKSSASARIWWLVFGVLFLFLSWLASGLFWFFFILSSLCFLTFAVLAKFQPHFSSRWPKAWGIAAVVIGALNLLLFAWFVWAWWIRSYSAGDPQSQAGIFLNLYILAIGILTVIAGRRSLRRGAWGWAFAGSFFGLLNIAFFLLLLIDDFT
jgi:hypothetical protein